ncbi:hypothetical protein F5Y13DRAFT_186261 [Hypoxylon sp. FL1857]|nr:hypothetical protein F5Y13DRAFT_186261 [Hypoxylon sp. FL1857]
MSPQMDSQTRTPSLTPGPPRAKRITIRVAALPAKKADEHNRIVKTELVVGDARRHSQGSNEAERAHPQGESQAEVPRRVLRPRLPRFITVYRDGCRGRLHSIYSRAERKYIYHHEMDAGKPIEMTVLHGKVVALKNGKTGKVFWVSNKKSNP